MGLWGRWADRGATHSRPLVTGAVDYLIGSVQMMNKAAA